MSVFEDIEPNTEACVTRPRQPTAASSAFGFLSSNSPSSRSPQAGRISMRTIILVISIVAGAIPLFSFDEDASQGGRGRLQGQSAAA
jgi:hypothetical protein